MKIFPDRLADTFKPTLPAFYLISGDETLLINEAADTIRSAAREQGYLEREVFYADSNHFDWEPVLQSLNSMSLFSEKKILEIHCNRKNLGDEKFLEYWQRPNPDIVVLVIVEKLDKSTLATKWFTALEKAGYFLQIWPLDDAQLNRWLTQRAKRQGLNIDSRGIQILQERTEGNLLASVQELEKLHLLYGSEMITTDKLLDAIANSARYDVFKLTDTILAGNRNNALKMLRGLIDEGTAESVVLWALTRELRILATTSDAVGQGQPASSALARQGVWEKRQSLFLQALKRLDHQTLYQLLQAAQLIDLSIKGLGNRNSKDALENLCLSMAGKGSC